MKKASLPQLFLNEIVDSSLVSKSNQTAFVHICVTNRLQFE